MKDKLLVYFTTFVLLSMVLSFTSCLDDDDDGAFNSIYTTMGEVRQAGENQYFLETDSHKKLYVRNSEVLGKRNIADGDRIYTEFMFAPDAVQRTEILVGFTYKVLTKDVLHLTAENEYEIGDDNIDVNTIWRSGDYLNFTFSFYTDSKTVHSLNLVTVDQPKKNEAGYLYVEFRHNANYDFNQVNGLYNGLVSFNISDVMMSNPKLKGFIVRVNRNRGERFYKVDLEDDDDDDLDDLDDDDDDDDDDDWDDDDFPNLSSNYQLR